MTDVKIVGGKITVNKSTTTKGNGKPKKYPYPQAQYEALLKLAKQSGIDTGNSKPQNTKAVNAVTKALIEDFIANQSKPKSEK